MAKKEFSFNVKIPPLKGVRGCKNLVYVPK
jgi:hypothetical protein